MKIADLIMNFPVESRDITTIYPYPENVKLHSEAQIKDLAEQIKEFGWDQPIVVDKDGVIIKGHGRRLAALRLEMTHVPVVVRADLTEIQVRAARLADNRVAEGEVDTAMLQRELQALAADDFDLSLMGFTERELDFMTEDVTALDDSAFVDDLEDAVAEVESQTKERIEEMRTEQVSVSKALGFKSVPAASERALNVFMLKLRADYGLPPDQAFLAFVNELLEEEA